MAVSDAPGSAVLSQHARVARALIASVGEGETPSPYVVLRLAEHVATARAWNDLAAAPYLLDQLDPDTVAAAALRAAFGRSDLPGSIGASLSARHLFNRLEPHDRLMTRWIAIACGTWTQTADSHAWARIREREPPHVAMFGHQESVRAIVPWSQPGSGILLLTAGDDGAVRVWDPTTGRPASEPLVSRGPPLRSMVTMTVDGQSLLAAGGPGGIRLWDLETHAQTNPRAMESDRPVRMLTVLPNPNGVVLLASADAGGVVRLWRVHPNGLTLEASPWPRHRAQALAALSQVNGQTQLVTAGYDGYLRFWEPGTRRETASYPLRRGSGHLVNAIAADGRAELVAVSGDDGSIELLQSGTDGSLAASHVLWIPGREPILATALARLSGGSVLTAAACGDGVVRLFTRTSGEASAVSVLTGHRGRVHAVVFVELDDGRRLLATGGEDGTVRLWHPDPGGLPPGREAESSGVQVIATVPAEQRDLLVAADDHGSVQLHEAASGMPSGNRFTGHRGAIRAAAAARLPDGRRVLVTAGAERSVRVWDVATGGLLAGPLRGHQAIIHAVTVLRGSTDKWRVASAGSDSTIRLWDPVSGRAVGSPLHGHRRPVRCLAAASSPAGPDILISGGDDGTLRLWMQNDSGAAEFLRFDLPSPVAATALLTEMSAAPVVAAGGSDGAVRLWDTATGQVRGLLRVDTSTEITALATIPTETELLAAAYRDGAVRIWHPESGRLLRTVLLPLGQQPNGLAAVRSHLAICTERGFLGCELDPRLGQEVPR